MRFHHNSIIVCLTVFILQIMMLRNDKRTEVCRANVTYYNFIKETIST